MTPTLIATIVGTLVLVAVGVFYALRGKQNAVTSRTTRGAPSSTPSSASTKLSADAIFAELPETFLVDRGGYVLSREQAKAVCEEYGARQATYADVVQASNLGADWCRAGWVSDADKRGVWPIQIDRPYCNKNLNGVNEWTLQENGVYKATATCFGVKPSKESAKTGDFILPWTAPHTDNAATLPYRWSYWRG